MDTQFESGERMLQLPGCRLFAEEQELGTGQLTIEERCCTFSGNFPRSHQTYLVFVQVAVCAGSARMTPPTQYR